MRIAVAGTGGLARLIAHYIDQETSHQVILLSRGLKPQVTPSSIQIATIDYTESQSLLYALKGIDTLISTVTGPNQISLIQAAVAAHVRRFASAEFAGPPGLRSANDPEDRHRAVARQWLEYYRQHIQTAFFVCGILYERFQPGGLGAVGIGLGTGLEGEGAYMIDVRGMRAEVPCYDTEGKPEVRVVMTAATDVARFVGRALEMGEWRGEEMRMGGERWRVRDLVALVQELRGRQFDPIQYHNPDSLRSAIRLTTVQQDARAAIRLHALLATAEGRYDYDRFPLNERFPDVKPVGFREWLVAKWGLM